MNAIGSFGNSRGLLDNSWRHGDSVRDTLVEQERGMHIWELLVMKSGGSELAERAGVSVRQSGGGSYAVEHIDVRA